MFTTTSSQRTGLSLCLFALTLSDLHVNKTRRLIIMRYHGDVVRSAVRKWGVGSRNKSRDKQLWVAVVVWRLVGGSSKDRGLWKLFKGKLWLKKIHFTLGRDITPPPLIQLHFIRVSLGGGVEKGFHYQQCVREVAAVKTQVRISLNGHLVREVSLLPKPAPRITPQAFGHPYQFSINRG